jgi:hypothetical protein
MSYTWRKAERGYASGDDFYPPNSSWAIPAFVEDVSMANDGRQAIFSTTGDLISTKCITAGAKSLHLMRYVRKVLRELK